MIRKLSGNNKQLNLWRLTKTNEIGRKSRQEGMFNKRELTITKTTKERRETPSKDRNKMFS